MPMKFAHNNNPTLSFGINEYTRLLGTKEYVLSAYIDPLGLGKTSV